MSSSGNAFCSSRYIPVFVCSPVSKVDNILPTQSPELGEWDDSGGGWEDEAEEEDDIDAVLREKRQLERERRRLEQQRRKAEKEALRSNKLSASKIATKLS